MLALPEVHTQRSLYLGSATLLLCPAPGHFVLHKLFLSVNGWPCWEAAGNICQGDFPFCSSLDDDCGP